MRQGWKNFIIALFILIGVTVAYFLTREYGFSNIFSFYANFDFKLLALYIFTIFIIYIVLTWRWSVILKSRGHNIKFNKLFIYRLIGQSINFFTPGPRVGGEPTQATLLEKHNIKFTEGLSTIMIDKIIDTTTCGILFILGVILVGIEYGLPIHIKIQMIIGGAIFLALIIGFYYRMLKNKHFFLPIFKFFRLDKINNKTIKTIESKLEEIEDIMIQFYNHDKKTFTKSLLISLLSWIVMFFEYKIATTLLGLNLGISELFFIITFVGVAVLFPVPMAVGVLEAGQISAFGIIGLTGSAGVALAFLVRMKDILWGIVGIIFLALFGFNVGKTIEKKYIYKNKNKHPTEN